MCVRGRPKKLKFFFFIFFQCLRPPINGEVFVLLNFSFFLSSVFYVSLLGDFPRIFSFFEKIAQRESFILQTFFSFLDYSGSS